MHCKTLCAPDWYYNRALPTVVSKTMMKLTKWQSQVLTKNNSISLSEMNSTKVIVQITTLNSYHLSKQFVYSAC
jgi:hypothetical protein